MHAVVCKTRVASQYNYYESQRIFANVVKCVVKPNIDIFIVEYINCYNNHSYSRTNIQEQTA